ncbi:hypothetical protein [Arthrobacter woluwensis]|nr:hypothetical protein [Arthrobacter woluwensis]
MRDSARNITAHSTAAYLGAWGIATIVAATATLFVPSGDILLIVRDFAGLALMALGAQALGAGRYSGAFPPAYVLVACLFARSRTGEINFWAWPLDRNPSSTFGIITILLCAVLTIIYIKRRQAILGHVPST